MTEAIFGRVEVSGGIICIVVVFSISVVGGGGVLLESYCVICLSVMDGDFNGVI